MIQKKNISVRKEPSQNRGKRSVKKIILACQQLLETEGLDKISTKKIALAAELSTGSLYEYFPNKESILSAMLQSWLDQVIQAISNTSPQKNAYDNVFAWIESTVTQIRKAYIEQPIIARFYNSLMFIPPLSHMDKNHDIQAERMFTESFAYFKLNLDDIEKKGLAKSQLTLIHYMITATITQNAQLSHELMKNLRIALHAMLLKSY